MRISCATMRLCGLPKKPMQSSGAYPTKPVAYMHAYRMTSLPNYNEHMQSKTSQTNPQNEKYPLLKPCPDLHCITAQKHHHMGARFEYKQCRTAGKSAVAPAHGTRCHWSLGSYKSETSNDNARTRLRMLCTHLTRFSPDASPNRCISGECGCL